jgi:hypothetical protein
MLQPCLATFGIVDLLQNTNNVIFEKLYFLGYNAV